MTLGGIFWLGEVFLNKPIAVLNKTGGSSS